MADCRAKWERKEEEEEEQHRRRRDRVRLDESFALIALERTNAASDPRAKCVMNRRQQRDGKGGYRRLHLHPWRGGGGGGAY